jgi:hypothetical protein
MVSVAVAAVGLDVPHRESDRVSRSVMEKKVCIRKENKVKAELVERSTMMENGGFS